MKINRNTINREWWVLAIVIVIVASIILFHKYPRKVERIVNFDHEPGIFIVKPEGGYKQFDIKKVDLNEELKALHCVPYRYGGIFLQTDDILVLYDNHCLVFTDHEAYIYVLNTNSKQYKIVEKDQVTQIFNLITAIDKASCLFESNEMVD